MENWPCFQPSLFLPLNFACTNIIMREKLKERESLVWNGAHSWPSLPWLSRNSIEKGHGWVRFFTRFSLSFKFLHIIFARAKFKERERKIWGTRFSTYKSHRLHNPTRALSGFVL